MSDPLPSFSELRKYRKQIGNWPLLFFTLAITTVTFTGNLKTDERITSLLNFTAGCLFALGLLIALLKVISAFFTHRPARGLIDGLGAGLVAGVIGGFFGYGFHNVMELPGFPPRHYIEPTYYRIGLCVLFAVPVGGIMGMLCDLAHPDRVIPWRKYISAMILAICILLCVTGYGVAFYVPAMQEAGIVVSDIQLLFEIFLLSFSFIVTASFDWPLRRVAARLPILLAAIVVARLFTFSLPSFDPQIAGAGGKLYQTEYIFDVDESTTAGWLMSGPLAPWIIEMAMTIIIFMIWVIISYFIFFKAHRLTRWLDSRCGAPA
jgi:hypothetical protein